MRLRAPGAQRAPAKREDVMKRAGRRYPDDPFMGFWGLGVSRHAQHPRNALLRALAVWLMSGGPRPRAPLGHGPKRCNVSPAWRSATSGAVARKPRCQSFGHPLLAAVHAGVSGRVDVAVLDDGYQAGAVGRGATPASLCFGVR